ncbi:MAG: hypothetical protein ABSC51_11175, partial [Gaiellaceae bacterium]
DPAEMKGKIRPLIASAALGMVIVAAGCGGHKVSGVFSVKKGMTQQQVRKLAGAPYARGSRCWLYHASKKGTPIDGMRFCFKNGRVSLVQTAVHL